MPTISLSKKQRAIVKAKTKGSVFLEGPAGTGKTTVGFHRLQHLLESDVPAESILVMTSQRTLAVPYENVLRGSERTAGGQVTILTMGGLARRLVDIFWPVVAESAGFKQLERRPTFLSLKTSQYYMASLVRPLIEIDGYFDSVRIDRNRLYSEIIDNLNKSAIVNFPYSEIGERLNAAWIGEESQRRMYKEVQDCANRFREFCLTHNLLDFSLQMEVFKQLWKLPQPRQYISNQFKHLIADNVEEDNPTAHDLLADMLHSCESALLIYDTDAGYRSFLGSDPIYGYELKNGCKKHEALSESYVTSPDVYAFGHYLGASLNRENGAKPEGDARAALLYEDHRYHPQMLDWVADEIANLVHNQGISAGEIVVMAPYLSDVLRFSLMNRLEARNIPSRSHRPSRSLREEPAAQCLLTLAQIAHPQWGLRPTQFDVAYAFITAIEGLDLVRGQLLAQIVYRIKSGQPTLSPFDQLQTDKQERITYLLGGRYETLRVWLAEYMQNPVAELDHFFSRLFGEVLSQEGFGFHRNFDSAKTASNLIDSAQRFRWVMEETGLLAQNKSIAQEYVQMVQDGVIANQYISEWDLQKPDAVFLAPAYTFLMSNQPVDYQFWLNVGSAGWYERLYQPLTHPYVLSRQWNRERVWTDVDEHAIRQDTLYRLVMGLIRRCRCQIYLGFSEYGEQGDQQRGPLLQAIYRTLRRLSQDDLTVS
jgi:hypothetical protein